MPRRHDPGARVVGAFVRIPEPLTDGKVRCNGCSKVATLTPNGLLRKHKTPAGEPCAYTASYRKVGLDEIPPVVLPPERKYDPPRPRATAPGKPPAPRPPSRLDAGSACRECGKWLPGERYLCGACSIKTKRKKKSKGDA